MEGSVLQESKTSLFLHGLGCEVDTCVLIDLKMLCLVCIEIISGLLCLAAALLIKTGHFLITILLTHSSYYSGLQIALTLKQ